MREREGGKEGREREGERGRGGREGGREREGERGREGGERERRRRGGEGGRERERRIEREGRRGGRRETGRERGPPYSQVCSTLTFLSLSECPLEISILSTLSSSAFGDPSYLRA